MSARALLLALLLVLLTALGARSEEASTTQSATQDLSAKVLAATSQQDMKQPASEAVSSHVVAEAPPAELANGDDDINTTGDCETEIELMCSDVLPGQGKMAGCVMKRVKDEERGNTSGRRVSGRCKKAVAAYYAKRALNVNSNVGLSLACFQDIAQFCKDVPNKGQQGAVLACLRAKKKKLRPPCQERVVKAMIAGANDFRADPGLAAACTKEAERLCPDVLHGEGRVQACLVRTPTSPLLRRRSAALNDRVRLLS
jgi:golgi apparatus protein 1